VGLRHFNQVDRFFLVFGLGLVFGVVVGVGDHCPVEDFVGEYQELVELEVHKLTLELVLFRKTLFALNRVLQMSCRTTGFPVQRFVAEQ
jgi:hypothetical protein